MVFGKQGSTEGIDKTSMISSRSFHVTVNDRKPDESSVTHDTNSTTVSKLFPMQGDNIPMNIVSRYDNTSLMNKPLAIVRKCTCSERLHSFPSLFSFLESIERKENQQMRWDGMVSLFCRTISVDNYDDQCKLVDLPQTKFVLHFDLHPHFSSNSIEHLLFFVV